MTAWPALLLLLFIALALAFRRLRRAQEEAAAVEARNRLALQMHADLEQELTFIALQDEREVAGLLDPDLAPAKGNRFPRRDRSRDRIARPLR